jgi:hypothetical protein
MRNKGLTESALLLLAPKSKSGMILVQCLPETVKVLEFITFKPFKKGFLFSKFYLSNHFLNETSTEVYLYI